MSSNIRIVQSALRASRKNKLEPDKKTKIILPILFNNDWLDNPDYKKVKEVITQMGLEDETIIHKIEVFKTSINKKKYKMNKSKDKEDNELLVLIKSEIKNIKRAMLGTTYEKAKKIIKDYKIKSKEEYYELCDKDNRLSKEPDITYKSHFTNWIDYLSIERNYYELNMCKDKINEYLKQYPELKKEYLNLSIVSQKLCLLDINFPPNDLWVDYYNVKGLNDIIIINTTKKKCGL